MPLSNVKNDPTLALTGYLSLFAYRQGDLDDPAAFLGQNIGYSIVDSLTTPYGDLSPIHAKNPNQTNSFLIVGKKQDAPDLGEASIIERVKTVTRGKLERIAQQNCNHVFIVKWSSCQRPDDLDAWDSLLLITGVQLTELDWGTLMEFDATTEVAITGSLSVEGASRAFVTALGEIGESIVLAEIVDTIFADDLSCGTCSPYSDGCSVAFALCKANASSPGLSAQVAFRKKDGTVNTDDINSLTGGNGSAIVAVGRYLLVFSETDESQHYALKADVLNDPGTYNWTEVSTGYVTGAGPRNAWVQDAQNIFIVGADGYIYKSTNLTAGVSVLEDGTLSAQDMNAIHGNGVVIAAVGNSNVVKLSVNGGATWQLVIGPAVGVNLTGVWVVSPTAWYVTTANGKLYYTMDQGENWTQRSLPNQANWTYINDIVFSPDNPEIGVMAVQTATAGYVLRTCTGGRQWSLTTPYIVQLQTAPEKFNAVALCGNESLVAGGKQASSTDGVWALGLGPA